MRGLMYFCANWGALECQLKDLARKWHRMIRNDSDKFPYWDKIEEYDECCRSCENRLLLSTEAECVICQQGKLEVLSNPRKNSNSFRIYYYCSICNTSYYSYKKLNKKK